jgi:hypothetical protein
MRHIAKIRPFIIAGLVVAVCLILIIVWSVRAGEWGPSGTSDVTELGVCLQNGLYNPVIEVQAGTGIVYACGVIEGTSNFAGGFYLISEREGQTVAMSSAGSIPPGPFFRKLQPQIALQPGKYRIEAWYSQQVRAVASFVVVKT